MKIQIDQIADDDQERHEFEELQTHQIMGMIPSVENNVKQVTLGKNLVWKALGDGLLCETEGCENQAFKYCDFFLN